jgi:hypothetical protein
MEHILLPDGSIRFEQSTIERLLQPRRPSTSDFQMRLAGEKHGR